MTTAIRWLGNWASRLGPRQPPAARPTLVPARSSTVRRGSGARRIAPLPGGILVAEVFHARLRPRGNAFSYKVNYLCVPLSQIDRLDRTWMRLDRPAAVAFHRRDHGDGGELADWLRARLRRWHLDDACDGEIILIALPRLFGYVFNPVSFWCCHDSAGGLRAVLCEVRNTFHERHNYLVFHDDRRRIEPGDWLEARKLFHVSPFMPVAGHYRFRFTIDADRVAVTINYDDGHGPALSTRISGTREALDDRTVVRRFLCNPLMTFAVIFRIHWQAVRLWFRRTPFFVKPAPPKDETTR